MTRDWTTSGPDLHLALAAPGTRHAALEDALRSAIREGRLAAGTRLPSTRALAGDLGLSRGTVVEAFAQLAAEGYLDSRHGAGTWVADVSLAVAPSVRAARAAPAPGRASTSARAFPISRRSRRRPGRAPCGRACAASRQRLSATAIRAGAATCASSSPSYLARARGVRADPELVDRLLRLPPRPLAGGARVARRGRPHARDGGSLRAAAPRRRGRRRPLALGAGGRRARRAHRPARRRLGRGCGAVARAPVPDGRRPAPRSPCGGGRLGDARRAG